jgi:hypothetical protein
MQAQCEFKSCSKNEERYGRAVVTVGAAITLITLLVLLIGLFMQG